MPSYPAGDYKVTEIIDMQSWAGQHGPMVTYTLRLENVDKPCEINRKPDSPAPGVGEVLPLQAWMENPQFPAKYRVKKAQAIGPQGFNPAPKGRSPEENARIMRQHSQDMALRFCEVKARVGALPADEFTLATVFAIAAKFDDDAKAAKP